MASRVASVRIVNSSDGGAYWDLTATATTQDTAAGVSVAVSCAVNTAPGTLGAPTAPTNADIYFLIDATATQVSTFVLSPAVNTSAKTFYFTATGAVGAAIKAGTIRMKVRLRQTAGLGATQYDVSSEGGLYGTQADVLATASLVNTAIWGFIRGTTTAVTVLAASTDPSPVALAFSNILTATTTLGAAPFDSKAVNITFSPLAMTASAASTGTTFVTALGVVDNRFPVSSNADSTVTVFPVSALTGLPWTVATTLTETTRTIDPRLTKVGLLQPNSNTWGSLPLSKDAPLHNRATSELGFMATRYRNANNAGVNGLTVSHKLQDIAALTTAITWSDTTSAQGGEDGWTNTLQPWSAGLPGGYWNHTSTVTAPSNATGLESTAADQLTLLAKNPNYQPIAFLALTVPGAQGNHAHAGDAMTASLSMLDIATDTKVGIDAGSAVVSIVRYNRTTLLYEALNTDKTTWSAWTTGVLPVIAMAPSVGDPLLFQVGFAATETAGWSAGIIEVQIQCKINGTPYGTGTLREIVSNAANGHDKYRFDPLSVVGFGAK